MLGKYADGGQCHPPNPMEDKMPDTTTPAAKPARKKRASAVAAEATAAAATATAAVSAAADNAAAATVAGTSAIKDQIIATRDTIRDEAQRKAGEIGEEVSKLYSQAGDRARDAANLGKSKAAEGLESLAKVIEDSAPQVDGTLGKTYGDFARSAAQSVGNLAGTLEEKDIEELVASTRDFVRNSPAVAIGGAAVIGFMLARLLRSRD